MNKTIKNDNGNDYDIDSSVIIHVNASFAFDRNESYLHLDYILHWNEVRTRSLLSPTQMPKHHRNFMYFHKL